MISCLGTFCKYFNDSRAIAGVRGFSRETLIALVANIESRKWRRQYIVDNDLSLEHSQASMTDDIECFFSVLRDTVGKDFIIKEVRCYLQIPLHI